jgi:hypothetical protein
LFRSLSLFEISNGACVAVNCCGRKVCFGVIYTVDSIPLDQLFCDFEHPSTQVKSYQLQIWIAPGYLNQQMSRPGPDIQHPAGA